MVGSSLNKACPAIAGREPKPASLIRFVAGVPMPRASNHRRNHGGSTRIPKAELTGIYGAMVERMSRKLMGDVLEPAT